MAFLIKKIEKEGSKKIIDKYIIIETLQTAAFFLEIFIQRFTVLIKRE